MRVVIVGSVVANGGDAAIMHAQLELVRVAFPGVVIAIHDSHPAVARRRFPGMEVHPWLWDGLTVPTGIPLPRRLRRAANRMIRAAVLNYVARTDLSDARRIVRGALRSLADADLVAYTGGTSLIERYPMAPKLFELRMARLLQRRVVLLPGSLGPFERRENQDAMRAVVEDARLVLLRDQRSKEHLSSIGARLARIRMVPDVVFALAAPGAVRRLAEGAVPAGAPRIAVSVRDCTAFFPKDKSNGQNAYEDAVAYLVTHLSRGRGADVTFVSTCQGIPGYAFDDSRVARSVAARLPGDVSVHIDPDDHAAAELRDILGNMDLLVSTRLHGAILALMAGTPVLPIAYEFKTDEVMQEAGLGEFVCGICATGGELVAATEQLLTELPARRPALAATVSSLIERAQLTASLLATELGNDS